MVTYFYLKKIKNILGMDLIGTSEKTFYISGWSIVHLINGIIIGYIYLHFKWNSRLYILNLFIIIFLRMVIFLTLIDILKIQ